MRSPIVRWNEDEIDFNRFFEYNELSPSCLVWRPRPLSDFNSKAAYETYHIKYLGETAGSLIYENGYKRWRVHLNHRLYTASRIVYRIKVGPIPHKIQVDHKDRNSTNNKISNLRLATHGNNRANSIAHGELRVKGVYKYGEKYKSYISDGDRGLIYVGTFDNIKKASEAYEWYANKQYGEFARA